MSKFRQNMYGKKDYVAVAMHFLFMCMLIIVLFYLCKLIVLVEVYLVVLFLVIIKRFKYI